MGHGVLDLIPAVSGQKVGYILDRSSVNLRETQPFTFTFTPTNSESPVTCVYLDCEKKPTMAQGEPANSHQLCWHPPTLQKRFNGKCCACFKPCSVYMHQLQMMPKVWLIRCKAHTPMPEGHRPWSVLSPSIFHETCRNAIWWACILIHPRYLIVVTSCPHSITQANRLI